MDINKGREIRKEPINNNCVTLNKMLLSVYLRFQESLENRCLVCSKRLEIAGSTISRKSSLSHHSWMLISDNYCHIDLIISGIREGGII